MLHVFQSSPIGLIHRLLLNNENMEFSRRQVIAGTIAWVVSSSLVPGTPAEAAATVLKNGSDISWLPTYESAGGKFYTTAGKLIDAFALMKANGLKVARIRIFVNPSDGNGRLDNALSLATRAKAQGIETCIDLHFSDTWADPGHQITPAGWSTTDVNVLASQVKNYVITTLNEFKSRNLPITYVQLGNEVTNGFMWPLGQINSNSDQQWKNMAQLFNAATQGLRQVAPTAKSILHLDCGGDSSRVRWWLMKASLYKLRDFNIVGLSYYSQWHGTLAQLTETLEMVAWEFEKPVLIAETAYPYTTARFGSDVIDTSKSVLPSYPATPAGQAAYAKKLVAIMKKLSYNNGVGVWWWEGLATHVVRNNQVVWDSGMTNSTLVDSSGKALPALASLK